ncbi:hypothetical protein BDV28DRAFT_139707 [Aspergillus coremiiformis]|uniref:Uncharacterized protein n=1 Tax=Aspergillus coremiiformis TaxID=138285 RepID=A0A5N6YXH1_9EURO|nr:hypothetical protein BDV28DRAFT_139707 [Aspergillus coremiiformis]
MRPSIVMASKVTSAPKGHATRIGASGAVGVAVALDTHAGGENVGFRGDSDGDARDESDNSEETHVWN